MGGTSAMMRRQRAKGNLVEYHRGRTQGRETLSQAHDWVRQALCTCAFDLRQEPGAGVPHAGIWAGCDTKSHE